MDLLIFFFSIIQPVLLGVSNPVAFVNPKAPVYPRLALGKSWDEVSFFFPLGLDKDLKWVAALFGIFSLKTGLFL